MYRYTTPGTIKQGYLTKSPPLEKRGLKIWKKRWCVFTQTNEEPCLNYYHSEEEAFNSIPIKRVNLRYCFKVEMDLIHSSHKNIFAMHLPERIYYFSAPSQTEMLEWADTTCSHLNLTRSDLNVEERAMPLTPLRQSKFQHAGMSTLPADYGAADAVSLPPKRHNSPLPPIPVDTLSSHSSPSIPDTYSVHARSPEFFHPNSLDREHSHLSPPPISTPSRLSPYSPTTPSLRYSPSDPHGNHPHPLPSSIDHVSFRPPAPIPKTMQIEKCESFDLPDNPPTPPPRNPK